jgi:CubicO group peptidase (beta-lactamase class C family)
MQSLYYRKIFTFLLLLLALQFFSCQTDKSPLSSISEFQYGIPVQTDDGWETACAASMGMDTRLLVSLEKRLNELDEHRIHSLLVVKNGKLVFERYFPGNKFNLAQYTGETGFDMDDTHNLCSATKSFTSALIGIAIDKGFIQSVNQGIFENLSDYAYILNTTPQKGAITIKHLLTMTSGLEWDDETYPYSDPRNDLYQMFNSIDPIRFILLKPLIEIPGTFFAYRNCNTNLLGAIVHQASEDRLDDFSRKYLFNKLQIHEFEWQMISQNVVFCSGDLRLRPRDMAKFGYLYLNEGVWKGERIISQEWINQSVHQHISFSQAWGDLDGYGYQWWLWNDIDGEQINAYAASGWGGQWIVVLPEHNTVFVTTGGNYYTEQAIPIESLLANYIIPSLLTN